MKKILENQLNKIPNEAFPKHVLIIPDGNGRWAKKIRKIPAFGHMAGFQVLNKSLKELQKLPINIVTIWAFSSDNWKRNMDEVDALMKIYEKGLKEVFPDLLKTRSRFVYLGRKDRIPNSLKRLVENIENQTKSFRNKILCIALDFSGTDQELRMMQDILKLPKKTKINIDLINRLRDGKGEIPPADLIIRTSGEQRVSDLGWLSQNSEFFSIKKFLPDTKTEDFIKAIINYSKRERRFGARPS